MQKNFLYQNIKISYSIHGHGEPVVLIHGFAEDSAIWQQQVHVLQQHFMVITPDLPGSGRSAMLQKAGVSIDDYAACINALLHHQGISHCTMLGHSMGGYITIAFEEMYPGMLRGFGFVNSTAFADTAQKKESRAQGMNMIKEHGAFPFIKNSTPGLFAKKFKAAHTNEVMALVEKGKQFSAEALIQYYTAMMNRPDRTFVLRNAAVPVLFIIGAEDNAAPQADLLQQVYLPNTSFIHILDGVGHMSMLEAPGKVNKYLHDFCTL